MPSWFMLILLGYALRALHPQLCSLAVWIVNKARDVPSLRSHVERAQAVCRVLLATVDAVAGASNPTIAVDANKTTFAPTLAVADAAFPAAVSKLETISQHPQHCANATESTVQVQAAVEVGETKRARRHRHGSIGSRGSQGAVRKSSRRRVLEDA